MTDKEYRKQKKRVQKYLDKWVQPMGLKWFTIDIEWSREKREGCSAETQFSNWAYRKFRIVFYLPHILDCKNDSEVEDIIVHELCHILTAPMANNMRNSDDEEKYRSDLIEQTTETIAQAFIWVRQAKDKK